MAETTAISRTRLSTVNAPKEFLLFLSEKKHEYEEFDNRILNEKHLFETKRRKFYEESQKLRLNWRKSEFRPLLKNLENFTISDKIRDATGVNLR